MWLSFLFSMVYISSWNVRGLNDPRKRCLVKSAISNFNLAIWCLQETKVGTVSRSFLRSFAGPLFDKCMIVKAQGASGGIITCWRSTLFSSSEVIVRRFSLTVRFHCATSRRAFYVTNVYGPPTWEGKEEFCTELANLRQVCKGPWVVCGDFNLTRAPSERSGGRCNGRLMSMFSDLLDCLELIDLPLGNQSFTWSNLQSAPSLAKRDRFLVSLDWDQAFPLSCVTASSRITSDHSPIVLSTGDKLPPRVFRFEPVWLTREDFRALVPVWWNETPRKSSNVLTVVAKLRHCRKRMNEWKSTSFYAILNTKKALAEEIQKLDILEELAPLSPQQAESRIRLKGRLKEIAVDEELLWQCRAKQHWLREGDGNTKFFHAFANGRRRSNTIHEVESAGVILRREEDKREYFFQKFKEVFAPDNGHVSSGGGLEQSFQE